MELCGSCKKPFDLEDLNICECGGTFCDKCPPSCGCGAAVDNFIETLEETENWT